MIVSVLVKPGAKKGPLIEAAPSGVVVYLREKAHDGEANKALTKVLAKHYGVAKSCVNIIKGQKSHRKVVEIFGGR